MMFIYFKNRTLIMQEKKEFEIADYKLFPMNEIFSSTKESIKYFSKAKRKSYIISFNEKGELINSDDELMVNKTLVYVIDHEGTLYGASVGESVNHSFFLAGGAVIAAGIIETDRNGHVTMINNESGHYTPTTIEMIPALLNFIWKNVSLQDGDDPGLVEYHEHDRAREGIIGRYRLEDVVDVDLGCDKKSIKKHLEIVKLEDIKMQPRFLII